MLSSSRWKLDSWSLTAPRNGPTPPLPMVSSPPHSSARHGVFAHLVGTPRPAQPSAPVPRIASWKGSRVVEIPYRSPFRPVRSCAGRARSVDSLLHAQMKEVGDGFRLVWPGRGAVV